LTLEEKNFALKVAPGPSASRSLPKQVLLRLRIASAECLLGRWSGRSVDECRNGKRTAPSRDRNRDLRITCIAAIPRSTTELKKLVLVDETLIGNDEYIACAY
jgi:hypothetical protein